MKYWGTSSGGPLPEPYGELFRWTAQQVREYQDVLASWPLTTTVEIDRLGKVFCHATPRNETEIFTRLTSEERLVPVFAGVDASVVVCGHTHMQFDRMVGRLRVVNPPVWGCRSHDGRGLAAARPRDRAAKHSMTPDRGGRALSPHRLSDGRRDGGSLYPEPTLGAGALHSLGCGRSLGVRRWPDAVASQQTFVQANR